MATTQLLNDMDEEEPTTERRSWLDYARLITVEPSMFFYMMAFMLTSVVEQAFFVHKACRVDMGYPEELCNNLTAEANKEANKKVQVVVSTFHQYNDIASQAIPIFLALFIGAWSDRRGRKLLLLLGLLGKLWYSVWVVINSLQDTWTVNLIFWTASLPSGLTGADVSIFAAAFSYLCDVAPANNRTIRVTILDITYLASMPIGIALGKYLFSVVNNSYTIMFSLNSALLVCSIIYSFVRLDWATTPQQKPLKLCCLNVSNRRFSDVAPINDSDRKKEDRCCLLDFFDLDHLIGSMRTIYKNRPNHGRIYLYLLIISLGLYTFQRDERQMSYLYTNIKFGWGVPDFSDFRTYQSAIYVAGTLLCIPLMGKYFKLSDTTMLLLGTTAHASARVIFALAEAPWLFYLGATVCSLGPVVAPVLRSMASKIVPLHERGKVFAVLSVADTAVPLFSGTVYSQVYNHTIHTYPSAIYWVTVATQMSVFAVALIIRFTSRGRPLESCAKDESIDQNTQNQNMENGEAR